MKASKVQESNWKDFLGWSKTVEEDARENATMGKRVASIDSCLYIYRTPLGKAETLRIIMYSLNKIGYDPE